MNANAWKKTATPPISGLQETKNKLQSINVFFDHRYLQICLDIQLHPPALDNVIVLFQMPGNAIYGVMVINVCSTQRLVILPLCI